MSSSPTSYTKESSVSDYSLDCELSDQPITTKALRKFQGRSFFYRWTHPFEKRRLEKGVYIKVIEYFSSYYNFDNCDHTERVCDFLLKSHHIKWNKRGEVPRELFERIDTAFDKALVYTGQGVPFTVNEDEGDVSDIGNFLFCKTPSLPSSVLSKANLKRVLITRDPVYEAEFRAYLKEALRESFSSFLGGEIEEPLFKAFLYNTLALIPYSYPEEGYELDIPLCVNGQWSTVTYTIDKKFTLSPSWFSSPFPIYGLIPTESNDAPPIMLCLGTTYPAGEGAMAAPLFDFTPGLSVGHAACLYGKEELTAWLSDKRGVQVSGISLGGAISLHLARLYPDAVNEVNVFNPTGQYPWNWSNSDHAHINFHIYSTENDLVSTMGFFPEGENVNYFRILAENKENFLAAHNKVYSSAPKTTLIRSSTCYENRRLDRKVLTFLHMVFSPLLFFALIPVQAIYKLCQILYRQISHLCYARTEQVVTEDDHDKLFGSGTTGSSGSSSEGYDQT